jgi:MFS family permease
MDPYKTFIRNYILGSSLYDFVFAYAIYNLLFSLRGLSVLEISLLLSWWALTAMLLEVPSGALADRWSRRKMLAAAPVIKAACFFIWYFAGNDIYIYGLGFLFWSIGSSMVSGTSEALLYDELTALNRTEEYEKILSKKEFWFHISLAVSTVIGGFIAYIDIGLNLLMSVPPLLLSSYFVLKIKETKRMAVCEETRYFEYIKLAYREVRSSGVLKTLFLYSLGISVFGDIEEFDQLYYQLADLPIYAFGIAGFFWSLLNSAGSYHAHRLKDSVKVFYILPLISALLLIYTGFRPGLTGIGILLLSYFVSSPLKILIESRMQRNIRSVGRATVTSMSAFFINLSGVILIPVYGIIGKLWGLETIYIATGVFLAVFSVWTVYKRKVF